MEFVVLWFFLALIPSLIARSKGLSFIKWHIYGFWLFPIALVHSIVAKPKATS